MSLNELVGIYLISVSFGYVVNKVLLHCCVADKMHFSVREYTFLCWKSLTSLTKVGLLLGYSCCNLLSIDSFFLVGEILDC